MKIQVSVATAADRYVVLQRGRDGVTPSLIEITTNPTFTIGNVPAGDVEIGIQTVNIGQAGDTAQAPVVWRTVNVSEPIPPAVEPPPAVFSLEQVDDDGAADMSFVVFGGSPGPTPPAPSAPGGGDYNYTPTLWVNNQTGDDAYTRAQILGSGGTLQWATVGRAARGSTSFGSPNASEAAQAGDVVAVQYTGSPYLETGYTGTNGSERKTNVMCNPANDGTSVAPIVFTGVGGRPQIRAENAGTFGPAIGSTGRDYIHWHNFDIWDFYLGSWSDFGPVAFSGNCTGCALYACYVRGHGGSYFYGHTPYAGNYRGVALEDAYNLHIADCTIWDIYQNDESGGGGAWQGQNEGGILGYDCQNITIENCLIYNCGTGIWPKGSHPSEPQYGWVIRNNWIANCKAGLQFLGCYDCDAYQNVIFGAYQGIMHRESSIVTGEQGYNNRYVNNTVVQESGGPHDVFQSLTYGWYGTYGVAQGGKVLNNIIYGWSAGNGTSGTSTANNTIPDTSELEFARNCYGGITNDLSQGFGANRTLEQLQAQGVDLGSIEEDPLFTNYGSEDFTLQAGSPALTLGRDYLGLTGGDSSTVIPAGAYITGSEQIGTRVA